MDSIDRIIFNEIRTKKFRNRFNRNFRDRSIISRTIASILTSAILYYNVDSKVKAFLINSIALVIDSITKLEMYQTLLKNYKDNKFSKQSLRLHRAAIAKLYKLARSMNLSRRKSIFFMDWRSTAQNSMEDFLLFLWLLGKLLGSKNDHQEFQKIFLKLSYHFASFP